MIPDFKRVAGWANAKSVLEATAVTPAALVVYLGDKVSEEAPRYATRLVQTWAVVVAVRSPASASSQDDSRSLAGPLITQVIGALQGFTPADGYQWLRFADGVRATYYEGGAAAFLVPFKVEYSVKATG